MTSISRTVSRDSSTALGSLATRRRDAKWRDLTNGALADAAFREGFRVILTRDRLFGMSARRVLVALPGLAIVVVTLPQAREEAYLGEFEMQWRRKPIEAVAGTVVEWP